MIQNDIQQANFEDTGFHYTFSLISGKHKMAILYCLMEFEVVRFNQLKRYLKTISDRTLSSNLKKLEAGELPSKDAKAQSVEETVRSIEKSVERLPDEPEPKIDVSSVMDGPEPGEKITPDDVTRLFDMGGGK